MANLFNNMGSSKYNKVLTAVLIIVIIIVVGLLIFFGYDVYKKYYIEKESKEVASEFEGQLNAIFTNEQVTDSNSVDPNIDLNTLYQNEVSSNSESPSNSNTVTYKGYPVIGTIEIPETKIKYPILDQVSIRALEASIGYIYGSGDGLNTVGNCVLVGHNYRNGTFFSNNKKLKKGDKIYITSNSGEKVTYVVTKKYETSTSDFNYANRDTNGKREISLSTCTDDTKKRLIIWAVEE